MRDVSPIEREVGARVSVYEQSDLLPEITSESVVVA